MPILAKLLGAYLVPTVATFAGFGYLAHYVAARSLEEELGRRLTAVAAAAAAQVSDENLALLQKGDEATRTYRNVQKRLEALRTEDGGGVAFAVGVDGAASLYEQLAGFRRTLLVVGAGGTLAVVVLSILVARLLVRPVKRLERAAARIGAGDLDEPVVIPSRDEIGRVAETLEDMRRQLRSRDERMQMMLAGIAHEVRNPLGGMALYSGLLRDDLGGAGDEEKLQHLLRIEREVERLKIIVNDFLEYARRPKPDLQPQDLAELLGEVRDLALAAARPRQVAVTLEATPARAACDSGQLRRALLNLAQNAVQACPTDGTGRVSLGVRRAGGEVLVTVHDSGLGIDPATLDKIWTPFYTTKQQGTGLGLAFVRDIALDHGARIDVTSQPGHGTTFTLALPEAA